MRSAQNARRHGLTIPAARQARWQNDIAAFARLVSGDNDDPQLNLLAMQVATAQIDLMRVREARLPLLEAATPAAIVRLSAIDRYEGRVRLRRNSAMRAFAAARLAVLESARANLSERTQALPGLCETAAKPSQSLPKRTQADPGGCQNEPTPALSKRSQGERPAFAKTKPNSAQATLPHKAQDRTAANWRAGTRMGSCHRPFARAGPIEPSRSRPVPRLSAHALAARQNPHPGCGRFPCRLFHRR
jgi:hypothetical protein